jgi:hypothetical protein
MTGSVSATKKAIIVGVVVIGVIIGGFWVSAIGAALNGGVAFAKIWNLLIYITCPVIPVIWLNAWLVPICNGLLYGVISYMLLRPRRPRFSK